MVTRIVNDSEWQKPFQQKRSIDRDKINQPTDFRGFGALKGFAELVFVQFTFQQSGTTVQMVHNENSGFGPDIEDRKSRARICSIVVCFLIFVAVIVLTILVGSEFECYERNVTNGTESEISASPFAVRCGKRIKKTPYSAIMKFAFGVIGVVLGTLLDRLCLVAEEYWHKNTRYEGSSKEMIKACFSGIQCDTLSVVLVLACLLIIFPILFEGLSRYGQVAIIILSGLSAGPLVLHLLNLDTQSKVHISTLMEKMDKNVSSGLAWSYYFGYLKIILPELQNEIIKKDWRGSLSSRLLFILIPLDCLILPDIHDADGQIAKEDDWFIEQEIQRGGLPRTYRNQVYCITGPSQEQYYILLEYASPLASLNEMSLLANTNIITNEEMRYETRLFYKTLQMIMDRPPGQPECRGRCVLVPYDPGILNEHYRLSTLLIEKLQTLPQPIEIGQNAQDPAAEHLLTP